ncbi:MAG: DUF2911 domain-containing protein [Cyclobacteriaceae bacterium]
MKINISLLLLMFAGQLVFAQIKTPPPSPAFEVKGTVGFADMKVVYSRPSAKGREVAGNLIPYGEVWRTGANGSTKISFSETVKLDGHEVPAGEYALYTIFGEEKATVILSKNLTWWGTIGYDEKEDFLRFEVPVKHPSSHYETFTISFSDFARNSANLNMKWEHTKAMFKIESDIDARIMADIKKQLIDGKEASARSYYDGAGYYYDTDRDAKLALSWINKGIELSEKEQYWMWHLKAKLEARNGMKKDAEASAKKSTELAMAAGNPDYLKLNNDLIGTLK